VLLREALCKFLFFITQRSTEVCDKLNLAQRVTEIFRTISDKKC
jgi:hypothetical protein